MIPDVVEQSLYLDECSRKVGIEVNVLSRQLKLFVARQAEENYKRQQANQARASIETIVEGSATAAVAPSDNHTQAPAGGKLLILLYTVPKRS